MKITAINREHSDKDIIAFVTEPLLTPQVFEEFKRHLSRATLQTLSPVMDAEFLALKPESFTQELKAELERLLTQAEEVVSGVAAKRQAEMDESDKEITLESASAGFGVPVV